MARRSARTATTAIGWVVLLMAAFAGTVAAAGPPFPDQSADKYIYDDADAFPAGARRAITGVLAGLEESTGARVVIYTQVKGSSRTGEDVQRDAEALVSQWQLGGPEGDGAVLFWDFDRQQQQAIVRAAAGDAFLIDRLDQAALDQIVEDMGPQLANQDWSGALADGVAELVTAVQTGTAPSGSPTESAGPSGTPGGTLSPGTTPPPAVPPTRTPAAGPPYPDPINDVTVYDYAHILSPATIADVTRTIAAIEARTAAEVVVYTQVKPESDSPERAEADAIALIDQWGVGRKGFDDGLAILFDLDRSKCHGQVQLYAGPGYRAAFLSNSERQAIFDDDMVPFLRECDMDGALLAAIAKVDANATPEHASKLATARQLDAAMGLILAPLVLVGLVAWAGWSWLRFGRDPVYLDDPSVLMAGPPADMSAAAAAVVLDGKSSRHALTTAMVDLASRGEIAFRQDKGLLSQKVGVQLTQPDPNDARVGLNRRGALDAASTFALGKLQTIGVEGVDGYIEPDDLLKFGKYADDFDRKIDDYVADQGWFREPPDKSIERWGRRGAIALIGGFVLLTIAFNLPSTGLELVSGALIVGAIAMIVISRVMPQRTMDGARVYAMLAAYRRTLQKTLEQSRSMDDVVASKALPWLVTPDQAVVWGVGLGLHEEVEDVLKRSLEDVQEGRVTAGVTYFPIWYSSGGSAGDGGFGGGMAPGLFSSGALPDFGGMMSALGTIGNSPSSSGSSGSSGGFSGGGSGGGGGGAGGGF